MPPAPRATIETEAAADINAATTDASNAADNALDVGEQCDRQRG